MALVLAVDGGPAGSLSGAVLDHVAERLEIEGHTTFRVAPTEIGAVALRSGSDDDPVVGLATAADGLVLVLPSAPTAGTTLLRQFLDALTARRSTDWETLVVRHGPGGPHRPAAVPAQSEVFVLDDDVDLHRCGVYLSGASDDRVGDACSRFLAGPTATADGGSTFRSSGVRVAVAPGQDLLR